MSEQILLRIEKKLDHIVRLLAKSTAAGKKQSEAIEILASAGLDRGLVAELLNTTPNTVSVTLSVSKSRRRPPRKPPEGSANEVTE